MTGILKISSEELDSALSNNKSQYLVGNLKLPQDLDHIYDGNVEVGMAYYKEFTSDIPHVHEKVTEYQLILKGYSEIKNLITGEVTELSEGDFYVVQKETPYAQKSSEGTKLIFFKFPGVNDKEIVEIDDLTKSWLEEKI